MLFQTDIEAINAEIAQLQEFIKAKLQHQNQLQYLQNLAGEAVKSLQDVVTQISNPDERKALQKAVVSLFDSLDNSNEESPTLPTAPVPAPVITATPAPAETVVAAPIEPIAEAALLSALLPEEDSEPDSGFEEVAEKEVSEPAAPDEATAAAPEPGLIQVTSFVSYLKGTDRAIQCTYVGFNNKSKAQSWGEWLTSSAVASSESCVAGIAYKFEVKSAVQLSFKYELWVWGLNLNQVNQLARLDFSKTPKVELGKAIERPLETSQLLESTHRETDLSTEQSTESDAPTVPETDVNASLYQSDTLEAYPELAVTEDSNNQSISENTSSATIKPVLNGKVTGHVNMPAHEITLPTATPSQVAPKLSDLEPNDIVGSLSVPGWTYKVLKVKPNGQLSCERLLSAGQSFNVALDINGVYLIEKAPKEAPEPEPLIDTSVDLRKRGDGETRRRGAFDAAHSQRPSVLETAACLDEAANSLATVEQTSPEPSPTATQPNEPMTPLMLASLIRAATRWEEIETATTDNEQHKDCRLVTADPVRERPGTGA